MKRFPAVSTLGALALCLVAALPVNRTSAASSGLETGQPVALYATTSPLPLAGPGTTAPVNSTPSSVVGTNLNKVNRLIPRSPGAAGAAALALPAPAANRIAGPATSATGFNGLTNRDQELAGTGAYQLSQGFLEPPDQGLCVGNGYVIEPINDALQVYSGTTGTAASAVTPLNQFFQVGPEASRTNPTFFGAFLSDPRCYYDSNTARWFASILDISVDPATGVFTDTSFQLLAVSQSSNPLGTWNLYRFSTTDDGTGGTQVHAGCPCFGDQPLLGADKYGVYITTNEYPITGPGFNGAQVFALSKAQLVNGTASRVVHINAGLIPTPNPLNPNAIWYSLQPATSPASQFETANNGTEYFLSALDFNGTGDTRIATWALLNTASLDNSSPLLSLRDTVVGSERYIGFAPGGAFLTATQKAGPTPLATYFNFYFHTNNGLEVLQANDDRMNQVVFAAGKLWSGVNTSLGASSAATTTGIAYFIVTPSSAGGNLTATMTAQGYVSAGADSVLGSRRPVRA
jgi:hypothetical protein